MCLCLYIEFYAYDEHINDIHIYNNIYAHIKIKVMVRLHAILYMEMMLFFCVWLCVVSFCNVLVISKGSDRQQLGVNIDWLWWWFMLLFKVSSALVSVQIWATIGGWAMREKCIACISHCFAKENKRNTRHADD